MKLQALLVWSGLPLVMTTSSKMDFLSLGHARTDPVTNPTCLSSHVHTFYGAAASLRPSTSYEELRAACGNSGNVDDNKSLYWHPSIYRFEPQTQLYHVVDTSFASAYYIWETGQTRAFPDGFQMIARQSSGGKARVFFDCSGPSRCERDNCTPSNAQSCPAGECLPTTACHELEIKIVFPSCWDGSSLTSTDFMSHMAYPTGNWDRLPIGDRQGHAVEADCPASHPVRVPEVQFYFRVNDYPGGHHVFSDGTATVHADYFSGWDEGQLQAALDACENDSTAAMPNAWCEEHFRFRDLPKRKGDERIVEKLRALQPQPPLDLQRTVSAEPITRVRRLPGGAGCGDALVPADPGTDWRCTANCTLLGTSRGDLSGRCPSDAEGATPALTTPGHSEHDYCDDLSKKKCKTYAKVGLCERRGKECFATPAEPDEACGAAGESRKKCKNLMKLGLCQWSGKKCQP